jgi:hypothetical protein
LSLAARAGLAEDLPDKISAAHVKAASFGYGLGLGHAAVER